jgi:hypothetical protein
MSSVSALELICWKRLSTGLSHTSEAMPPILFGFLGRPVLLTCNIYIRTAPRTMSTAFIAQVAIITPLFIVIVA